MPLVYKNLFKLSFFTFLIVFVTLVNAATPTVGEYEKSLGAAYLNYGVDSNLYYVLTNLTNFLLTLGYVLVFLFIGISGFKFIISGGDKNKKTEAIDSLKYALIALLVLLAVNSIITIFSNMFTGADTGITTTVSLEETF